MSITQTPSIALSNVFSTSLVSELQTYCKEEYGRNIDETEAQDMCLKIATFVFIKRKRQLHGVPTI